MTHRDEYETQRRTLEKRVEGGDVDGPTADAIEELCDALDDTVEAVPLPDHEDARAVKTLDMYTRRLRLIAERFGGSLLDTTADALNEEMQRWLDGTHPAVDDDGLAPNTVSNYQGPLRVFYRYHDFGIDPCALEIETPEISQFSPSDVLSDDDIARIRATITCSRDRMVFELLLNTGVRNTAARTVEISNLDLRLGVFHLNEDADGLKGATDYGTKRPLLGAEPFVRDWLRDHPCPGNPDAHLITNRPGSPHLDPTTPVSHTHLGKLLKEIKESADIEKPLHPHALRHNFVTRARRGHDMDDATIKYLIGHPPDSTVMERTYQHISSDSYVQDTKAAAGEVSETTTGGLAPETCLDCGAKMPPGSDRCQSCGTVYSPAVGLDRGGPSESPTVNEVAEALVTDEGLRRRLASDVAEQMTDDTDRCQGSPISSRSSSEK